MRRRRVLAFAGAAAGFSGCLEGGWEAATPAPTDTADRTPTDAADGTPTTTERAPDRTGTPSIGGSLNGRPFRLEDDLALVERSDTTWLHAFLDVRRKLDGNVDPEEDPDVVPLRRAARELGTRLVVSLQWDFIGLFANKPPKNVPESGSSRERRLFEYATELLEAIGEPVDVVVLGNEPIWEALDEDVQGSDQPLVPFTRNLKEHLVEHYPVDDTRLFLGSFNRLYGDYIWRAYGDFYEQLLEMARTDEEVDGIDLHVHYDGFQQAESMFATARERFPDGSIIATEFSPVWRYDRNKEEPIAAFEAGERFADRYGISADTTVTEYLEAAKEDRLSHREMADFMEAMPWYNVDFVEDMYRLLEEYDVEVGTFGFLVEDDVHNVDWREEWVPFPINCLFQPALIDTDDGAHPHYLDDFRDRT